MRELILSLIMVATSGAMARAADSREAWLGLQLKAGSHGGALVRMVMVKSPAAKAGVVEGEELLSVDGVETPTPVAVVGQVKKLGVGHAAQLKVLGAKGERTVTVPLEARPDYADLQRDQLLGLPAPEFTPKVQAGAKVAGALSSLRGQVVLLDFYATWCGPCVASMPHLNELQSRYAAKGLKVIGISGEEADVVEGSFKKFHLGYSVAADEGEAVSASYHVFALPTMVLIDREGVVREVSIGGTESIDRAVLAALAAPSKGSVSVKGSAPAKATGPIK